MPYRPYTRYRPTRTSQGHGSFTEALGPGYTIYGIIRVHESETSMSVASESTVNVDDIVVVDTAQYRVRGVDELPGSPRKRLRLERVEAPITP